jgi:hypothetical protein
MIFDCHGCHTSRTTIAAANIATIITYCSAGPCSSGVVLLRSFTEISYPSFALMKKRS